MHVLIVCICMSLYFFSHYILMMKLWNSNIIIDWKLIMFIMRTSCTKKFSYFYFFLRWQKKYLKNNKIHENWFVKKAFEWCKKIKIQFFSDALKHIKKRADLNNSHDIGIFIFILYKIFTHITYANLNLQQHQKNHSFTRMIQKNPWF